MIDDTKLFELNEEMEDGAQALSELRITSACLSETRAEFLETVLNTIDDRERDKAIAMVKAVDALTRVLEMYVTRGESARDVVEHLTQTN